MNSMYMAMLLAILIVGWLALATCEVKSYLEYKRRKKRDAAFLKNVRRLL